jgi:hypothetical protein
MLDAGFSEKAAIRHVETYLQTNVVALDILWNSKKLSGLLIMKPSSAWPQHICRNLSSDTILD